MIERSIGCLQTRDYNDARNAAGGQEVMMPVFCAVYECSNRPNQVNTRSFHRVQKCGVHNGKSIIINLVLLLLLESLEID